MKNLTKILLSIYVAIMMIAVACKKEEPTPTPPATTPTTTPPVVKSTAKDITKFSFAVISPVVDATIDASTKAITATVSATTDVTKLVPTITISDKSTVSPATGVAQDFSKEVSYTVTAEDGGTVVWKVNVTKEAVASAAFIMTTKQKMPVIADMHSSNKVFFTINSKIYYLGASKASANDFKYFFEYDPATDKWTQKADFPLKRNLDGTGFPVYSNFAHNGKAYFSNAYYGFTEYDPITDKWRSLNYAINNFYRNPVYFQGSLYGFGEGHSGSYEFDTEKFDRNKFKSYKLSGDAVVLGEYNRSDVPFIVDNKVCIQVYYDETTNKRQSFNTYEVDYANSKYIKISSFEGGPKKSANNNLITENNFSKGYFIDGRVYYFAGNNVLIYDAKTNTFQSTKPQNFYPNDFNSKVSGDWVVIGKSIYVLGFNNAVVSMQIP